MEKPENVLLTILTPTYNRAHMLPDCYRSLKEQTCQDFEWVVADDGSTDETDVFMAGLPRDDFQILYFKKENGGKHTALNAAHPYIHGKYVLILDSDDRLTSDAVERVAAAWEPFENDPSIGIVTLLKGSDPQHPNCYAADEGVPVDIMSYRRICPVSNDACEVIRASIFCAMPFPVFPGERFLSEGALWNRVSFTHKCVYVNRVVYLCSYLEGGLTRSGKSLRIRNPLGGMYTADLNMARKNGLKRRVKNGILYDCYGFFSALSLRLCFARSSHKVITFLCLPFGYVLYRVWEKRYSDIADK